MQGEGEAEYMQLAKLAHIQGSKVVLYSKQGKQRGLYAINSIQPCQTLMSIPYASLLTNFNFSKTLLATYLPHCQHSIQLNPQIWSKTALAQQQLQHIQQATDQRSQSYILPLMYMFESKHLSQFTGKLGPMEQQYFSMLPLDFETMPYYHANMIHHPTLQALVKEQNQALEETFAFVQDIIKGTQFPKGVSFQAWLTQSIPDGVYLYQKYCQLFTLQTFLWSHFAWNTRAFKTPSSVKQIPSQSFLAPAIDMLNHNVIETNVSWQFHQSHMKIVARRPIQSGQELLAYYSNSDQHTFFTKYGFVSKGDKVVTKVYLTGNERPMMFECQPHDEQQIQTMSKTLSVIVQRYDLRQKFKDLAQILLQNIINQIQQRHSCLESYQQQSKQPYLTSQQRHIIQSMCFILQSELWALNSLTKCLSVIDNSPQSIAEEG